MATVPESLPVEIVQGQTYLYVFKRIMNAQYITLVGGPSSGTWQVRAYGVTTAALAYNASAAVVQAALQLIPRIGANGVSVSRTGAGSGGDPYVYRLDWAGNFLIVPIGQRVQRQPLVEVITTFSPAQPALVEYVPFDFTGWTMTMVIAPQDDDGTYGTTAVEITEASTEADPGRIYIGYVPPAAEGGAPGALVPTNGTIALMISAAKTASLVPADFTNSAGRLNGRHSVVGVTGDWAKTLYDGPATLRLEPS